MNKKNLEIKGRELELFLIHHPSVLQIKVEEEQDKQIAYFVPTANQSPKKYELRQYVKQNMTVDLSSTVFVEVPSLEQAEGTFFPMSPSTVTEELVAEIWEIWSDRVVTDVHELFLEQTVAEDMVDHLQQTFEVELSTEILLGFPLNEVAEYIDTQLEVGKVTEVVNKDNPVILSSSQQRLWFWEQLIPGTTVYSVPAAYRLTGHIEVERLQQAFEQVITRHGILRVTFHANEKGVPEQRIQSSMENWFSFQDLCKEEQPEKVVNTLIQHHLDQPFDLEQGPLFRVSLYRLEEEWRLLIQAHHLVMDGWSLGILIKDFASFYEGVQVSPNQYDYLDYAIAEQEKDWNREEEQLKYWVDKLQDMPATQLSTDYPRPAKESYRGSAVTTSLSSSLVRQLRHVAQSTNSSLYMVLLTAFKLLLSRYSGEKEMVVGSPVAGRFQSEWEKVIGFFVNTIVLRTDFSDNPSWNQALDRVKDTVLDAFSYQEVPFDRVVEAVLPDRQSSLSPLFQAMFVLQNMNLDTSSDSSLHLEPIILDQKIAKFDLTLTMVERAEELDAILEYNTDLYAVSTIDRMLEQFKMILESLVTDQYTPINEVNIITTDEKRKWLEWNQTEKRYKEESLATLFEQMVQQDPNAIAIQSMNQTCSYQELNNKANQVAWYLSSQGIGHGDKVGICFERSMEFYISILGIVKLGAVYVPFDVNYPRDRFDYLLDDAQLSHVLTSSTFADRFDHKSFRFSIWEEIKFFDQNSRDFPCHATIDSLTYVMYTSGSTGLPKGVEITARGIVRLVQNPNYMQIHKDDVFLQLSPVAFDAATLEIWGSFLNGAKLVIMPSGSPTLEEISQEIIKNKVTILWLTAGLFRLFVEEQLFSLSGLRYLLTGGDVVSASHVKQVLSLHGPQVINGYGPTENTTFTCCYPLPADWDGENSVPIGRPISGTYVYILDENGKDVPIGVPGELYIGGDGLACGYANRQELTDEKFVTLSDKGRLYRSGDLVRIDSNGLIHFIGRLDNQVKVRGFRVELGEIEAVLATHADVNDVVVLAKEDHSGKQLVAYVQTNKEINWKSWLESTLPSYMIPSRFLSLPTFPLTSNGKIDRKQLDALELPMDRTTENVVEPVKEEEKQLHSIWSEVLGHDQFGIHHNFFSIGGHSLLATQVIARVHKVFDISLPLQSLFTAPTIAEFVLHLQNQNEKETLFSIHTEKNGEIPASFGQKRLWFMDQYTTDQSIYHMPFMVEIKGTLHQDQLEKSYLALLERHASMRTNFYFKEGQLFQKISEPSNDCFEYEDLRYSDHSEDEAKQNMDQVINRAFDLANGPLAVLYAYQLTNEHWYLLFHLHHIVADGGSLPILMDELFVIYHDKELPPLTLQYADYAWQEQAWMENESMQQELGYWKTKLADLPVLDLPTDHPRGSEQTFAGATYSVTLSEELRAGIARWSKKQGTTFYMTTLAVFQTLLARYTGSTDIAVGSPVAGRSHAEWESLIGFFVNTLVFRNDLSGEPTWNDVLQRVKQGAIEAYSHATVPFERVVEEVAPDRHLSHSPLFQVMFSVETDAWQAPEVAGLAMQEVALPQTTAKFDL
uniref:non-ribosomal peptide synthetase n=1 Tax=Shimazuella kribbensis TaxID=139808 RepID=UPI000490AFC3